MKNTKSVVDIIFLLFQQKFLLLEQKMFHSCNEQVKSWVWAVKVEVPSNKKDQIENHLLLYPLCGNRVLRKSFTDGADSLLSSQSLTIHLALIFNNPSSVVQTTKRIPLALLDTCLRQEDLLKRYIDTMPEEVTAKERNL